MRRGSSFSVRCKRVWRKFRRRGHFACLVVVLGFLPINISHAQQIGEPGRDDMLRAARAKIQSLGSEIASYDIDEFDKLGCSYAGGVSFRCSYRFTVDVDCQYNPILCLAVGVSGPQSGRGLFTWTENGWYFQGDGT